jgi:hypothetical protein
MYGACYECCTVLHCVVLQHAVLCDAMICCMVWCCAVLCIKYGFCGVCVCVCVVSLYPAVYQVLPLVWGPDRPPP